ncbi:MAG: hypothetical protein H0U88_03315 [Chthoniobacterales bacterium]|nr:hypothetical protein [Chthoniobacterales bacterium]
MTSPEEKKLRTVSFIVHATRGVIRDRSFRRKVMAALLVLAGLMLTGGSAFLRDALAPQEHAVRFILYWLACAWLTITALLLAIFDLLIVRAESRAARKRMKEQFPARAADLREENDISR